MRDISRVDLDSIQPKGNFRRIKKRLRSVHSLLHQGDEFSNEQIKSLIGLILIQGDFRKEYKAFLGIDEATEEKVSLGARFTGTLSKLGDWLLLRDPSEARKAYHDFFDLSPLSDRDYLIFLRQLKADQPEFGEVIDQIFIMAHQHIASLLTNALNGSLPARLQHDMNEREKQDLNVRCQQLAEAEEARSWKSLKDQVIQDLGARNEQYARIWFSSVLSSRDMCLKAQDRHRTSKETWWLSLDTSRSAPCDPARG